MTHLEAKFIFKILPRNLNSYASDEKIPYICGTGRFGCVLTQTSHWILSM